MPGAVSPIRSDMADRFGLAPRVLPGLRRRGVGTAATAGARGARRALRVPEGQRARRGRRLRAFAERFGFREVDRQVEQVKVLGDEPPVAPLPAGIEVVTVAERPIPARGGLSARLRGVCGLSPRTRPASVSLGTGFARRRRCPSGSFVALAEGEIVGYSGLDGPRQPGHRRGRADGRAPGLAPHGLARALKRLELPGPHRTACGRWSPGPRRGNEGMRRLNEQLGYEYRAISLTMCAPLPLPLDSDRS